MTIKVPTKEQERIIAQLVWNDFCREYPEDAARVMEFQTQLKDHRRGSNDSSDGEVE